MELHLVRSSRTGQVAAADRMTVSFVGAEIGHMDCESGHVALGSTEMSRVVGVGAAAGNMQSAVPLGNLDRGCDLDSFVPADSADLPMGCRCGCWRPFWQKMKFATEKLKS